MHNRARPTARRPLGILAATLAALTALWPFPAPAGHGSGGPVLAIPPDYVKRLLDGGEPISFVDLRPAEEFRKAHLPGAKSIPLLQLTRRSHEIPKTRRVVLYCACPPEQLHAAYQFLRDQGYRNLSVLEDGFPGWIKRGYPVEK